MVKQLSYMVLIGLFSTHGCWAAVESQVSHTQASLGDAIELVITSTETANTPDLSVLEADFEIASRRQESQFSMVNGTTNQQARWILTLYPRRTGTLQIPAITMGTQTTTPITLTITEEAPAQGKSSTATGEPDISIEFVAEPAHPFVQQQIILTQRLISEIRLDQAQAALTLPQIETGKGLLRQLGNPTNQRIDKMGKSYDLVERRFVLLPQQSGPLVIGRTRFDGIVPDNNRQGRQYGFGVSGRSIRRFSKPFELEIAPQEPSYTGQYWLPAKSVSLNAAWDKPVDQLKAGEPVTLTVAIMAEGLAAEQLPALTIPLPVGIKAYADQPLLNDQFKNDGIIGVRQEKWVLIASGGGDFVIPEMTLDWWNLNTQRQETARLDSTQFKVGGAAFNPPTATKPATTPEALPSNKATPEMAASVQSKISATALDTYAREVWIGLLLFVSMILGIIVWRHRGRKTQAKLTGKYSSLTSNPLNQGSWAHLLQACQKNDKRAAQSGLVAWARDVLNVPAPHWASLHQIASPELKLAMDNLELALYGKQAATHTWQGAELAQAIKAMQQHLKTRQKNTTAAELSPLHPTYD